MKAMAADLPDVARLANRDSGSGLRTPPRIPEFREISRRVANGPELAAHATGAWSLQTSRWFWEAVSALWSLVPEIPFPGGGARCRQRPGSNPELLGGKSDHLCCRDHPAGMMVILPSFGHL
jgi:hypothetical protein